MEEVLSVPSNSVYAGSEWEETSHTDNGAVQPNFWPQLYTQALQNDDSIDHDTSSQQGNSEESNAALYFQPVTSCGHCCACSARQQLCGSRADVRTQASTGRYPRPWGQIHCHSDEHGPKTDQNSVRKSKHFSGSDDAAMFSRSKSGDSEPSVSTLSILAHHHHPATRQSKGSCCQDDPMRHKGRARSHSFRCMEGRKYACAADLQNRYAMWNPCCNCLFSAFPDIMIIQEIFSFLDKRSLLNAAAVSRRWRFLANSPKLWREIILSDDSNDGRKSVSMMNALTNRSPVINSLTLRSPKFEPSPSSISFDSLYLTGLVRVDLSGMKRIPPHAVYKILRCARKLKSLCLDGVAKMDDNNLEKLVAHNSNLQELNIARCRVVTDEFVRYLSRTNIRLQHIDLTNCSSISIDSVTELLENAGQSIKTLKAGGVRWSHGQNSVQRFTNAIANNCPSIEHLDISSSDTIRGNMVMKDVHFLPIVQKKPSILQVLKIRALRGLSTEALLLALRQLAGLTSLDISWCTAVDDSVIQAIVSACRNLRQLNIQNAKNVSGESVQQLLKLQHLESVNLQGCGDISEDTKSYIYDVLRSRKRGVAETTL